MARPYSLDLRKSAVRLAERGASIRQVADALGIAPSSVSKWGGRLRGTGSVAPGKMGGHRQRILTGEVREWLLRRIHSGARFTIRGLVDELQEHGVSVSYRTVWNFLHGEGLSFKKNSPSFRTTSRPGAKTPGAMEKISK
jgi:putative transposase